MGKEEAKQKVAELVKKYEALTPSEIKSFNEAKTKQGFIDPLFRALGWNFEDINEVAPEEKASGGRVDYAFKINSVSLFFLEAKPLRADLTNSAYIKQAVTYAYNKGVTWALLTDFETLLVYVAQTGKPFITLTCNKYLDAFDDLWLLSKESFQNNALVEKAERYGALPQRMGIEQRLFNQLKQWREELSTQLHSYNKHLSIKQIDEVIQRLFNRLIFIRTCEDRGIENKVLLSTVHEWVRTMRKGELIEKLREVFHYFDGYYDSELFQKHLTDEVYVESNTVENSINGLYEVPGGMASYDFSIIDADVLGAVYEQYLGHIANIVKQKAKVAQAKMDLGMPYDETIELTAKKQRRKEHGIYYTPKFITDYIVKETVGRFLAERSTNEIRNIKILDPACGSGSFLIRAFDELLKHYAHQKISKSEQDIDAADRISILQSNIYGVDLDIQAVEIARLNLLLRSLAKREPLAGLKNNIKQGNSLISGTEQDLKNYFGDSWQEKKPFNWEQEFKDIIDNSGFDVVIGNPPYIRIQSLPRDEADYYRKVYESAYGSFDVYVLFIEQAIKLLKSGGRLGFITSGKFLKAEYGKKIQHLIKKTCTVETIIDLSATQVFAEATTYPVIIILRKDAEEKPMKYIFIPADSTKPPIIATMPIFTAGQDAVIKGVWPPPNMDDKLLSKLATKSLKLGDLWLGMFQGPVSGKDEVFILSDKKAKSNNLEDALLVPLLKGSAHIRRYWAESTNTFLLFPYMKKNQDEYTLISEQLMEEEYPSVWRYLSRQRRILEDREGGRFKNTCWYGYSRPQNLARVRAPKLLCPAMAQKACFFYDESGMWATVGSGGGGGGAYAIILKLEYRASLFYVLGILNSSIATHYLKQFGTTFRGGYFGCDQHTLRSFPIHQINLNNPAEKKMHDTLISLVDKMLELNKKLAPICNDPFSERDELKREIEKTDKEIDYLVYDLYGLTKEEREIVEGAK